MSKFYIEHKTSYLFVDCETTGLKPGTDEVLSISVIDQTGRLVFNSLIRPERRKKWVDAQNIHHISPEMVNLWGSLHFPSFCITR